MEWAFTRAESFVWRHCREFDSLKVRLLSVLECQISCPTAIRLIAHSRQLFINPVYRRIDGVVKSHKRFPALLFHARELRFRFRRSLPQLVLLLYHRCKLSLDRLNPLIRFQVRPYLIQVRAQFRSWSSYSLTAASNVR